MLKKLLLIFSLIIGLSFLLGFQTNKISQKPKDIVQTASVFEAISLSEKPEPKPEPEPEIGQLFIIGFEGREVSLEVQNLIKELQPGGIILTERNIENPEQLKNLIANLQTISLEETGLPLFITVDQEGRPINRVDFTIEKTAQSEISEAEEAYYVGLWRAKELKALGINLNLAPILDMAGIGDFIFERTFQKNVSETAELGKALVKGQKEAGILTAIKHFPGYGSIPFDPEEKLSVLSTLPEISQFQEVIMEEPEFVMCSNVVYEEIDSELPFCFSSKGIQFLKEKLGDNVLIMSDDLSQNSLLNEFSLEEIVVLPIKAGVDILLFSGWRAPAEGAILALQEAVKKGEISGEKIEEALSKVIKLKKEMYD